MSHRVAYRLCLNNYAFFPLNIARDPKTFSKRYLHLSRTGMHRVVEMETTAPSSSLQNRAASKANH